MQGFFLSKSLYATIQSMRRYIPLIIWVLVIIYPSTTYLKSTPSGSLLNMAYQSEAAHIFTHICCVRGSGDSAGAGEACFAPTQVGTKFQVKSKGCVGNSSLRFVGWVAARGLAIHRQRRPRF